MQVAAGANLRPPSTLPALTVAREFSLILRGESCRWNLLSKSGCAGSSDHSGFFS
jgi:hypothetical protein